MSIDIKGVQSYLAKENLDGWLIYDFKGSNPIAVDLSPFSGIVTRRWYLLIPREGKPVLLGHKIEESNIVSDWTENRLYSNWRMLEEELKSLLDGKKKIAMEYSPMNAIPYVSRVDAGTIEMVRSLGVDIVSSANLVQHFQARWSNEGLKTHKVAANFLVTLMQDIFKFVAEGVSNGRDMDEFGVQQEILRLFREYGMVWEHEPIVAIDGNAAKPHYGPTKDVYSPIREGNLLLIDAFCRQQGEHTISGDITWTAFVGSSVPKKVQDVFNIVAAARDAGVDFAQRGLERGDTVCGYQVDDAVRGVIEKAGYGEFFTHRTGHSLGTEIHSNGVNIDNFETRDERVLEPGVGFTIEPGIYLPDEFGIRSEINCYVADGKLEVTTLPLQTEVKALL